MPRWIWADLLVPRARHLGVNLVLDIAALGSQLGAYSLLFRYVSVIEQGSYVRILDRNFDPNISWILLVLVAVLTGGLLVLAGALSYYSRLYSLRLARSYEEQSAKRILKAIEAAREKLPYMLPKLGKKLSLRSVKKALIKDTRFYGKLVLLISRSMVNMGKLVLSLAFMLYIDFLLTALIIMLTLPLLLLLRRASRTVVRLTRSRESQLPDFMSRKKELMQRILDEPATSEEAWEEEYRQGYMQSFYSIYYNIFRRLAANDLIIALFIALMAVVIVVIAGNLVIFGDTPWSVFIAYMVALRFFFTSCQGMNGIIKRASRMYDYIKHYYLTLQQLNEVAAVDLQTLGTEKAQMASMSSLELDDDDDDDDEDGDF